MAAPLLAPFLASLVGWIFREVIIKFVVFSAVFAIVIFLVPYAVKYLGSFANAGVLTQGFSNIDPQVCFFLNYFALNYGMPLIISALVARFLIRRLPFIG